MVSRDEEESLDTSGLLRCTWAPQALATFSISSWSVETQTLGEVKCVASIIFLMYEVTVCSFEFLVIWNIFSKKKKKKEYFTFLYLINVN